MASNPVSSRLLEEGTQTDQSGSEDYSLDEGGGDCDDENQDNFLTRISRFFLSASFSSPSHRWTQTSKDPLVSETERLAFDIVFYTLGRKKDAPKDEVTLVLRKNVSRMLEKHSYFFSGLMTRLQLRPGTDFRAGFVAVAAELFVHDDITWAKIIALFAFGAILARHCSERRLDSMVYDVATNLAEFAVYRLTPFLKAHGGWTSVLDAFPNEEDYETKIWKSLLVTGLGLGAVAAFLAMQN